MMLTRNRKPVGSAGPTEPYLGDVIGEPLVPLRPYRQHYPAADWLRNLTHAAVATVGVVAWTLLLLALVVASFFAAKPVLAASIQYPIAVPMECVELAQRENVPLVIESKAQGLRVKYRLYRLSARDPLVRQCRDAVHQLEAMARASR